jgi:8-oxo-dGTP pyrophosphatase MutT (NUDIX family)
MLPAVAIIVRDPLGRVLFVRDRDSGAWGLPAGAIDPGEAPRDAAVRELQEECGIECRNLELVAGLGGREFRHTYPSGDLVEYSAFVYRGSVPEDFTPDPQDVAEVMAARFFTRDAAPDLALPYPEHLLWV